MSIIVNNTPVNIIIDSNLVSTIVDKSPIIIKEESNNFTVVVLPSDVTLVKSALSIEGQNAVDLGIRLTQAEADIVDHASDLASTNNNLGASLIGVEDPDGNFTGQDLESVLKEISDNAIVPPDPVIAIPTNLVPQVGSIYNVNTENSVITRVYLSWDNPATQRVGNFEIQKKISTETIWETSSQSSELFSLEIVQPNLNYDFRVRLVSIDFVKSDWIEINDIFIPLFEAVSTGEISRVTGLIVEDGEFDALGSFIWFGTVLKLDWRSTSNVVRELDDEVVADENILDWFNAGYRICLYVNGIEKFCTNTVDSQYTLPHEVFERIGFPRSFVVKVWGTSRTNTISGIPAVISVTNPAPDALTAVDLNIQAGWSRIVVNFTEPNETDYAGASVYISTVPGFTPSESNKVDTVYKGTRSLIIDYDENGGDILSDTTYYVQVGVFDIIDESIQSYSIEQTVITNKSAEDKLNGVSNWAKQIDPVGRDFIDSALEGDAIVGDKIVSMTIAKIDTGILRATTEITCEGLIKALGSSGYELIMGQHIIDGSNKVFSFGNGVLTKFSLDVDGNATFAGDLSAAGGSFSGDISAATGTFGGSLSIGLESSLNVLNMTNAPAAAGADVTTTIIDGGTIVSGKISLNGTDSYIRSGQTAYGVGTGWWLGKVGGSPKFSIGDSTDYLKYDTTNGLVIGGNFISATGSGKRIDINPSNDNEIHFYGYNGVVIQELCSIGIQTYASDIISVGSSDSIHRAIYAEAYTNTAITAVSDTLYGVLADSDSGIGIRGNSVSNIGVRADSGSSIGMYATGGTYGGYFSGPRGALLLSSGINSSAQNGTLGVDSVDGKLKFRQAGAWIVIT